MTSRRTVALFPLKSVLVPGALLQLKVFEARYLDLVSRCMREGEPFGVVCIAAGREVGRDKVSFELEGVLARLDEVDAESANLLRVRCRGGERFRIEGAPRQQPDGLWTADVELLPADEVVTPEPEFFATVQALQQVIATPVQLTSLRQAQPPALSQSILVETTQAEGYVVLRSLVPQPSFADIASQFLSQATCTPFEWRSRSRF